MTKSLGGTDRTKQAMTTDSIEGAGVCEHCGAIFSRSEWNAGHEIQCAECGTIQLVNAAENCAQSDFFPLIKFKQKPKTRWFPDAIPFGLDSFVMFLPLFWRMGTGDWEWNLEIYWFGASFVLGLMPLLACQRGAFDREGNLRVGKSGGLEGFLKVWMLSLFIFGALSPLYVLSMQLGFKEPFTIWDAGALMAAWLLHMIGITAQAWWKPERA